MDGGAPAAGYEPGRLWGGRDSRPWRQLLEQGAHSFFGFLVAGCGASSSEDSSVGAPFGMRQWDGSRVNYKSPCSPFHHRTE